MPLVMCLREQSLSKSAKLHHCMQRQRSVKSVVRTSSHKTTAVRLSSTPMLLLLPRLPVRRTVAHNERRQSSFTVPRLPQLRPHRTTRRRRSTCGSKVCSKAEGIRPSAVPASLNATAKAQSKWPHRPICSTYIYIHFHSVSTNPRPFRLAHGSYPAPSVACCPAKHGGHASGTLALL